MMMPMMMIIKNKKYNVLHLNWILDECICYNQKRNSVQQSFRRQLMLMMIMLLKQGKVIIEIKLSK